MCVYLGCCRFALLVPYPSDWLERLVPEMTCYVLGGTLNSTHSLTLYYTQHLALSRELFDILC